MREGGRDEGKGVSCIFKPRIPMVVGCLSITLTGEHPFAGLSDNYNSCSSNGPNKSSRPSHSSKKLLLRYLIQRRF
jgi:hypothetical protein